MQIIVDKAQMRMVAAAGNRKWANLICYVDFAEADTVVVDSLDGSTWTIFSREEMATLYKNMSGQPEAPEYKEAIEQLRAYSEQWPHYSKPEAALEREAEKIYAAEQAEGLHPEPEVTRETHQAIIKAVESAGPAEPGAAPAPAAAEPKAPKAKPEPGERPRQGITKRIWELADELLAVTGQMGNVKEFRTKVIQRAEAEGANPGTAATQFGKWKASKGL